MRIVKLLLLSLLLLIAFAVLYYGLNSDHIEVNTSMVNEPVPAFSLDALQDDKQLNQEIFADGDYTLLNVWASWCAACKSEHQFLISLKSSGIGIVGLNYRDNRKDALAVLRSDGNPYREVIYDPEGSLALDLGVIGAPETFVINGAGEIVYRVNGIIDQEIWQSQISPYFKM